MQGYRDYYYVPNWIPHYRIVMYYVLGLVYYCVISHQYVDMYVDLDCWLWYTQFFNTVYNHAVCACLNPSFSMVKYWIYWEGHPGPISYTAPLPESRWVWFPKEVSRCHADQKITFGSLVTELDFDDCRDSTSSASLVYEWSSTRSLSYITSTTRLSTVYSLSTRSLRVDYEDSS